MCSVTSAAFLWCCDVTTSVSFVGAYGPQLSDGSGSTFYKIFVYEKDVDEKVMISD